MFVGDAVLSDGGRGECSGLCCQYGGKPSVVDARIRTGSAPTGDPGRDTGGRGSDRYEALETAPLACLSGVLDRRAPPVSQQLRGSITGTVRAVELGKDTSHGQACADRPAGLPAGCQLLRFVVP